MSARPRPPRRIAPAGLAAAALLWPAAAPAEAPPAEAPSAEAAPATAAARPRPDLLAVIAALRAAPRLDRAQVERRTGARLTLDSATESFAFYVGRARLKAGSLALDWREPKPGGGATAGPLLNLDVAGACLTRAEAERRFGPLQVTDVPHGHSLDEQLSLSHDDRNVRLSFGFPERAPACAATITFAVTPYAA